MIPTTNNVDNAIFEAPTILLIKSDKPYCLNSTTILSNLNTQTIIIEKAIVNWAIIATFSIALNIYNNLI